MVSSEVIVNMSPPSSDEPISSSFASLPKVLRKSFTLLGLFGKVAKIFFPDLPIIPDKPSALSAIVNRDPKLFEKPMCEELTKMQLGPRILWGKHNL